MGKWTIRVDDSFQLTASQGGWHFLVRKVFGLIEFQLTASQGGWPLRQPTFLRRNRYFNSQPHKEADCCRLFEMVLYYLFQLTASQGGWRFFLITIQAFTYISTHSLTRRLTILINPSFVGFNISTHSLTRRLTISWLMKFLSESYFNSQPHKEADYQPQSAPESCMHFNSQPHKEADIYSWFLLSANSISTHSLTRRLTQRKYLKQRLL